jgi:hypothetical protein
VDAGYPAEIRAVFRDIFPRRNRRTLPELHCIEWELHDPTTAHIVSPTASVIKSYIDLQQMESLNLAVCVARANPWTFTEFYNQPGGASDARNHPDTMTLAQYVGIGYEEDGSLKTYERGEVP